VEGTRRLLLAVPSAAHEDPTEMARAEARLRALGGTGTPERVVLSGPHYAELLPLARMSLADRVEAVRALADDVGARSVTVTLDARVQAEAAAAAREAARRSKVGAAAVVVLDAHSGQLLARAQWPDFDPSSEAWRSDAPGSLRDARTRMDPMFMQTYGAWADKTDTRGVWQAGSVFKLLSAAVAVRSGFVTPGAGSCPTAATPIYACNDVRDGKPSLMRDGWSRPIHDFADGGAQGNVDLVQAITRSSNVWFGQLALAMGPQPYRDLRQLGVTFGNPELLEETDGELTGLGAPGSRRLAQTGFGQGAGSWSVTQAARFVGALANGGNYLACPADMRLDATCASTRILADADTAAPILAGMRGVMERGTGASLPRVPGVRLYGKTGTADARGTVDERPWGIEPGQQTAPHSWFAAIAEPEETLECGAARMPRYVVVAVVPHGGFGSKAAGPLALSAVTSLQRHGYLGAPP
jgi:cell division protein FtsI/penicillin-binding protein 2